MSSPDSDISVSSSDAKLLETNLQYQFVRTLLDLVWICCVPTAIWIWCTFPPEQTLFSVPGTIFIAVLGLAIRHLVFPKVKTLTQLDLLSMAILAPCWAMTIITLILMPETDAGIESVLLHMTFAAISIHNRWTFLAWFTITFVGYLGTRFVFDIPLTERQFLYLCVLIPGVTLLLRQAVASSFNAVFKENVERRSAAVRLSTEQLKLATVLQQAPLILCVIDATGNYLRSRGSGLTALGLKQDEIVGRHFRDVFVDQPGIVRAIDSALGGVGSRTHACFGDSHYEIRYRPVLKSAEGAEAVIGVGVEVTERVQLAEREKEDERNLLHSQKVKSLATLAGGIAHDFNNYLMSIIACCESLLQAKNFEHGNANETVDLIKSTALKAAGLSKQMLIYAGTDPTENERPQSLDLTAILNDSKNLLQTMIPDHAEMSFHVDAEIVCPVSANAVLLNQVILNVVKNAIDALPDKDGRIDIFLEPLPPNRPIEGRVFGDIKPDTRHWQIICRDNGCGISHDQLDCVLDLYYTTKSTGSGIGLAVTATIMRKFDGAIAISSEVNVGTTVRLVLPVAKNCDESPVIVDHPLASDSNLRRYLLVDDNEAVLTSMAMMLRTTGAEVHEAKSGAQAVAEVQRCGNEFDCIVLDYSMPKMDGIETLQRIRLLGNDTPVIMCSGYPLEINSVNDVLFKPDATLSKPFRLQELLSTLDHVFRESPTPGLDKK